jgi:hypothetical protein
MPFPANGQNLKLGKGSLMLAKIVNGVENGFDFAGNCSAISLSAETQVAEKYGSTTSAAPLIGRSTTRVGYIMTVTLDEFDRNMLAYWLLGQDATKNQTLQAGATVSHDNVVKGRYYEIGARRVTAVSVTRGSDTLVLNTDYTLNSEFGVIGLMKSGSIVDGDDIVITYSRPALTIKQIRIAKEAAPLVHMVYMSDDSNTDGNAAKDRLEVWRASIAPEGELNLISDEYGSYQLTMAVLSDSENHPADEFGTHDRIEAA